MLKFIHAMIRVSDLQRSLNFYQRALGLKETHRLEFEDFTLVYLRDINSGAEVELTWNKGVAAYDMGNAYGHLAFVTDDLNALHATLTGLEVAPTPIKEFKRDGILLARFFFIQDPDGYKIELLQKGGHYQ
ncbi:VOC family protein [Pseudomonas sp.]|uniref:VOC family protein n=1 Tax=Pseudomonas sp. TaxID=306 RepID=UPI0012553E84|nr:Lactoylglutathione lyase [Pseudomonas fluorescens]